jgi:flagellar motor switch/type III secretory pathway protein FliN
VRLGEVSWQLTFVTDLPPDTPMCAWRIQIGIERGWFLLESSDALDVGSGDPLHGLEPAFVQALLAEDGAEVAAQFAAATGTGLRVVEAVVGRRAHSRSASQVLHIENTSSGAGLRAVLEQETTGFFPRLASLLAGLVPSRIADMPTSGSLRLRLALDTLWLDRADAEASRPGDALIFPAAGTPAAVRAVCFGRRHERLPLLALIQGRTVRLTNRGGSDMIDEGVQFTDAADVASGFDRIVVPVTAVIGEIELPLRELAGITAGYVFELPNDVREATVRLYTGRSWVGTGKLVALGDRLAVRLIEWKVGGSDAIDST